MIRVRSCIGVGFVIVGATLALWSHSMPSETPRAISRSFQFAGSIVIIDPEVGHANQVIVSTACPDRDARQHILLRGAGVRGDGEDLQVEVIVDDGAATVGATRGVSQIDADIQLRASEQCLVELSLSQTDGLIVGTVTQRPTGESDTFSIEVGEGSVRRIDYPLSGDGRSLPVLTLEFRLGVLSQDPQRGIRGALALGSLAFTAVPVVASRRRGTG